MMCVGVDQDRPEDGFLGILSISPIHHIENPLLISVLVVENNGSTVRGRPVETSQVGPGVCGDCVGVGRVVPTTVISSNHINLIIQLIRNGAESKVKSKYNGTMVQWYLWLVTGMLAMGCQPRFLFHLSTVLSSEDGPQPPIAKAASE